MHFLTGKCWWKHHCSKEMDYNPQLWLFYVLYLKQIKWKLGMKLCGNPIWQCESFKDINFDVAKNFVPDIMWCSIFQYSFDMKWQEKIPPLSIIHTNFYKSPDKAFEVKGQRVLHTPARFILHVWFKTQEGNKPVPILTF